MSSLYYLEAFDMWKRLLAISMIFYGTETFAALHLHEIKMSKAIMSSDDENDNITSSFINETNTSFTIKYNLCFYKYDSYLKEDFDYHCEEYVATINSGESLDFNLQPQLISWPNLYTKAFVYLKQITNETIAQSFIGSKEEEAEFKRFYDKTKYYGVNKRAFSCRLDASEEKVILTAEKGFLCS